MFLFSVNSSTLHIEVLLSLFDEIQQLLKNDDPADSTLSDGQDIALDSCYHCTCSYSGATHRP